MPSARVLAVVASLAALPVGNHWLDLFCYKGHMSCVSAARARLALARKRSDDAVRCWFSSRRERDLRRCP
jgi:hypothetical protein